MPLTPDQLTAALDRFGVKYVEYPGWRTRGLSRAAQRGYDPRGITIHITAGGLGSRSVSKYIDDILLYDPSVPDKCNAATAPDGTLYLIAAGRANHHLYYSAAGLSALSSGKMSLNGSVAMRGSQQNFNTYSYGIENISAGPPNAAQRETSLRWAAAICYAHGWSGQEVVGHGELASDRGFSDPGIDMGAFRRDVMALVAEVRANGSLSDGSSPSDPGAIPAPSIHQEDDDMKMIQTTDGAANLVTPKGLFHVTDATAADALTRVLTAGAYGKGDAVHTLESQLADAVIRQADAVLSAADDALIVNLANQIQALTEQVQALPRAV